MNTASSSQHCSTAELSSTIAKCQSTSASNKTAASVIRKAINDKINKNSEQMLLQQQPPQPTQQQSLAKPSTTMATTASIKVTEIKTEVLDESKYASMDPKEIKRQKELDEKYGG